MLKLVALATALLSCAAPSTNTQIMNTESTTAANQIAAKSIYEFKVEALDGSTIDFSKFKGKKILVVNTASQCGYTPRFSCQQLWRTRTWQQYRNR
jgi:cytochrome oxidase Cu insertion factor (SCO1/SenC/PrrC family)